MYHCVIVIWLTTLLDSSEFMILYIFFLTSLGFWVFCCILCNFEKVNNFSNLKTLILFSNSYYTLHKIANTKNIYLHDFLKLTIMARYNEDLMKYFLDSVNIFSLKLIIGTFYWIDNGTKIPRMYIYFFISISRQFWFNILEYYLYVHIMMNFLYLHALNLHQPLLPQIKRVVYISIR